MTTQYNPNEIEAKWHEQWEKSKLYRQVVDWSKPKHYAVTMLPYPSGDLHIGHWYAMTPSDARARYMRMKGYNVLFPMGFDSFGLPAENAAVQRNIHPTKWTRANIQRMYKQLQSMGAMFDWERSVSSCEPEYYRWTEWFFKKFFEAGLAYRGYALVNWSPTLQTVLANEQVIDGKDERAGQPVVQRMMEQWFFRITQYADQLLDFTNMDWPEHAKLSQINWIKRSEGAKVVFHTESGEPIEIFTTRPDTLWGATFMVLAPEHGLVEGVTTTERWEMVKAYRDQTARLTEIERSTEGREKTGVFTGGYAVNPVNGEKIPIWIADYVLSTYGSGAIMAVPAHDQRDFNFAQQYQLPIRPVIQPEGEIFDRQTMSAAYLGAGFMINSGPFNGIFSDEEKGHKNSAIQAVINWLAEKRIGQLAVSYRLRDWLISRQRYWGAPIPIITCQDGTIEAVPDEQLPVLLPDDVEFMPTGQSPLKYHATFIQATDSHGRPAQRETDTLDTFMCSSWYQYRYLSPHYDKSAFDPEEAAYWLPVDSYTGGAEHYNMHLLYTRFFTKAMRDLGMFAETEAIAKAHGRDVSGLWNEPMRQLRNQGQILGPERIGDYILASGRWDNGKLFADHIRVIPPKEAPADFDGVKGEIMRRTEYVLQVATEDEQWQTVEVLPDAQIEIPGIEGNNRITQLRHHLEIQRMSKSKGNVVNPDELVAQYGADTVRAYLMFAFDWSKGGPWDYSGIRGPQRLIQDVWNIGCHSYQPQTVDPKADQVLRRRTHQTIRKVGNDLENFSFNTVVAALMEMRNVLQAAQKASNVSAECWNEVVETFLLLLAPVAPHITEELWAQRGKPYSVHQQAWPVYDPEIAKEEMITLVVQINGKVRDRVEVPASISDDEAKQAALSSTKVQEWLNGNAPRQIIVVPGRLINIVL